MGQFGEFIKPAMALWRAGIFFLIGIVLMIVSAIWHAPYADLEQNNRSWYHDIVDKTVGNLDFIALMMLVAGSIYAILVALGEYLWNTKLENSIDRGFQTMSNALALGSAGTTYKYFLKWIEISPEAPDKYKLIALSALGKCYGAHSSDENSYMKYVVENLIETHAKHEAITRHNYNISVVIRKVNEHHDLLQWEERKDYILKCPAGKTSTLIGTMISARANFDNVGRLIELLTLTIAIDGKPWFSFQKWKRETGNIDMSRVFNTEADGGKLSFDGKWMNFEYCKTVELTKPETRISIVEVSFITTDERAYSFISTLPSYNVSLSMRLEGLPNWQLQKPNIGTTWYHAGSSEFASFDQNNAQWVSASVPKWVLPGVWATVEWALVDNFNLGLRNRLVRSMF